MIKNSGIDYFGLTYPFASLHNKTTVRYRQKMYYFLQKSINGVNDKRFLDHGSTPNTQRDASNCFIKWLLADRAQVYATSPENIEHLVAIYPGLQIVPWPPHASDIRGLNCLISSAVIEHVGAEEQQIQYLRDLIKLCPQIFITTPNRYHWLEFHTKLPLIHWLPRGWHRWLLKVIGLNFWAQPKNLHLISAKEFQRIIHLAAIQEGQSVNLSWYKPRLLGLVSNLCILIQCTREPS